MKFLFKIVGLVLCLQANAQVRLIPFYPADSGLSPEDLWQVEFDNLKGVPLEVILISEIRQAGHLVFRRQSHPVQLPGGQQAFNPMLLQEKKTEFFDREFETEVSRSGQFPPGTYQICLLAKSPGGSGELGRDCRQVIIDQQFASTSAPQKGLAFSGRGKVEYFYTDQPFWGIEAPRQYLRFDLHPRVQWQDIPLGVDIFYTLGDQGWTPNRNSVSLHFEAQRFQEQIREKLENRLKAKASKIQENYALDFKKEQLLKQQLEGLGDSSLSRYQQLLPELESRLREYPEKELRYRERQLLAKLDAKRREYQNQKQQLLLEDDKQSQLDSLDNSYREWEQKQAKVQEELAGIQQKLKEIEQLKREIATGKQGLQQYRFLQGRSTFLQAQHQQLTEQNDSLRQLLPQMADLSDPTEFKRQLRQEGLFKKHYSWLMAIQELKVGTYRPHYSPLILNGAQANGLALRIRPQPAWEFSASVGKIQSPFLLFANQSGKDTLSPLVAAGKIAWRGRQFQVYGLTALPFEQPTPNTPESINGSPSGNLKLGAGLTFDFFDQRFTGQVDGAWTNPAADAPGGAANISFSQRTAFHLNTQWQFSEQTRLTALWQSVGTAYEDIGSPFLLSGMEQIDLQLEQSLWKDQVTLGGFYLKDKNRPIGFSPFTFQNHQYGLQLAWQAEGYPQLSTRLGRNLLSNEETNNQGWLWSFLANYPFRIGQVQLASQLSFQHTQQQLDQQLAPQLYTYLEVRQQVFWNDYFSTALSVYQNTGGLSETMQDFKGSDLQLSIHKNRWLLDITGGLYQQTGQELDHRLNLNLRIPVSKSIQLNVQAGRQPSFVNPAAYYFVRTGFSGLF